MGLGDFFKGVGEAAGDVGGALMEAGGDIGEAVGGDWVVDQALKVPDAAKNVYKAGEGLVKGSAWALDPTHWDDIGRGVGNVASFVAENPGQVWDTGFEVGRAILKDQLDPVNLAINAGLIAATVATGGAAAPALAAKVGMGLRSAKVGIEAVRAGEGVVEGLRAARTASTALKAARAGEEALGAVKATQAGVSAVRGAEHGADALKAVDTATDTGRAISRGDAFLGGVKRTEEGMEGGAKLMNRIMNPISRPLETFAQGYRDKAATRILQTATGEEAGLGRQIVAAAVQGNTGAMPTRLVGQSERIAQLNKTMWRGRQVAAKTVGYAGTAGNVQEGVTAAANPAGYAMERGEEAWAEHGDEAMAEAAPYIQQARDVQSAADQFKSGPDQSKERDPFAPIETPSMSDEQSIGLHQFRLDRTHATRTSRRQAGGYTQLGTVTTNVDMPTRIGPDNWYGPQGGYSAGRGFVQRPATPTMGLAPLEQPVPTGTRQREMVGI